MLPRISIDPSKPASFGVGDFILLHLTNPSAFQTSTPFVGKIKYMHPMVNERVIVSYKNLDYELFLEDLPGNPKIIHNEVIGNGSSSVLCFQDYHGVMRQSFPRQIQGLKLNSLDLWREMLKNFDTVQYSIAKEEVHLIPSSGGLVWLSSKPHFKGRKELAMVSNLVSQKVCDYLRVPLTSHYEALNQIGIPHGRIRK